MNNRKLKELIGKRKMFYVQYVYQDRIFRAYNWGRREYIVELHRNDWEPTRKELWKKVSKLKGLLNFKKEEQ